MKLQGWDIGDLTVFEVKYDRTTTHTTFVLAPDEESAIYGLHNSLTENHSSLDDKTRRYSNYETTVQPAANQDFGLLTRRKVSEQPGYEDHYKARIAALRRQDGTTEG